jgi:diguanylate cyclase
MIRFRSLRTRLTVAFVTLFVFAMSVVGMAVTAAVGNGARSMVRDELAATGAVYEAIWQTRTDQLRQGAGVLAQDFGFREAVATADEATVKSALDNLRARQGVDGALMMATDGYVTAAGAPLDEAAADSLWSGLNAGTESGVLTASGQPFQAVAAPIMAPTLIGWVIFVDRLDQSEMTRLQDLSAIPLTAAVVSREGEVWRDASGADLPEATAKAVTDGLAQEKRRPIPHDATQGESLTLAQPLPSFDERRPAVLTLTYPLKLALRPYGDLFFWLAIIGIASAVLLGCGAWALSRSVTRPISDLDRAVHALERGEHAVAPVTSGDEIGRLAAGFNAMVKGLKDREARLTHMALHDQETGLPNRRLLERQVAGIRDPRVMLIGLDRYEVVRNAIGHDAMSQLIQMLGVRLSSLAEGRTIARAGVDALGFVFEGTDLTGVEAAAVRLLEAGATPVTVNGAPIDVALTVGIGDRGGPGAHIDSPIDRASVALDQARAARRPWAQFDEAAYGDPGGNLSLISELMTALSQGQVTLAYQPKHDYRAQKITGVEALMRWTHPKRGFVPPDLFIGMAEETGHIRALTEWAVQRALDDQRRLAEAGHDVTMSVNLSGRLLSDESFADVVLAAKADAVGRLCLEITETAVMQDSEAALRMISRFADAGVSVSLDDYGSGLSSLAYLKQIQADELKIDKAFVMGLDQSSRDALLVKSTIDLAHGLGMKVTAEGVETETALALLRGMGCDMAQGYFIGRPMPLKDLIAKLTGDAGTNGGKASAVA